MEVRILRYFLAVAQHGSFTKAAQSLYLTQPTLSRQLKQLEEELGQQLFIRNHHTISLTPEGMILRKRAEEIIDMVEKTKSELSLRQHTLCGELHIGAGETNAIQYIAEIIQDIHICHPGIVFHIHSGNFEDVTEKLDKGSLDFGLIIEHHNISNYDHSTLPTKDVWGIIMHKDTPLAKQESISLHDIETLPLILPRRIFQCIHNFHSLHTWFMKKKDNLTIVATYNLMFNAIHMVEQGIGYLLCLNNIVNFSRNSSLCFRPLYPLIEVGWEVIWKKYQVFSPVSQLFLNKLRKKASMNKK